MLCRACGVRYADHAFCVDGTGCPSHRHGAGSFKLQIFEHVFFEGGPGGFGGVQAADCALDDAGMARAVAGEGAVETDAAELIETAAVEAAAGVGRRSAGDPDSAEGMDERTGSQWSSTLPGIAEYGVVEM